MKKIIQKLPLHLRQEAIRTLDSSTLPNAAGGDVSGDSCAGYGCRPSNGRRCTQ